MSIKTTLPPIAFSQRKDRASRQAISFLMQQAVENSDCLSLAAGLVDESSLPVDVAGSALEQLFADETTAQKVLQYGTTPGDPELRDLLLQHLGRLEGCDPPQPRVTPEQVILTTGSQQFLSIVADMIFDPGDICLVAAPTYFVFLGVLDGVGAKAIPVHTDENGMCPDALESQLRQLKDSGQLGKVKMIYLVSYFENPSGISLSEERRERMVQIARHWSEQQRILILEDAAYRELRYDGPALSSIFGKDPDHETVILTQTFSKSFSPGVRVGFGVVPIDLVKPINDRKGNLDFGSANISQQLLKTVINNGAYTTHVESVCRAYRIKRDAMLSAADEFFGDIDGVSWIKPNGGLYVWMSLPPSVTTGFDSPLFQQASKIDKVMYVPGELCYPSEHSSRPTHQMRLSFGVLSPDDIHEAMRRLANAVKHVIADNA